LTGALREAARGDAREVERQELGEDRLLTGLRVEAGQERAIDVHPVRRRLTVLPQAETAGALGRSRRRKEIDRHPQDRLKAPRRGRRNTRKGVAWRERRWAGDVRKLARTSGFRGDEQRNQEHEKRDPGRRAERLLRRGEEMNGGHFDLPGSRVESASTAAEDRGNRGTKAPANSIDAKQVQAAEEHAARGALEGLRF
jgi:hypothetical protein